MKMDSPQLIISKSREEGFEISEEQASKLYNYKTILIKWSTKMNLIGPLVQKRIWEDHFSESIWLSSIVHGKSHLADIGSGAGIPGIILACLKQETEIHLIESNLKKARFLNITANNLDLKNVKIISKRIEPRNRWQGKEYPIIVSRAAARLPGLINLAGGLTEKEGLLFALVGKEDLDSKERVRKAAREKGWEIEDILIRKAHGKTKGILILRYFGLDHGNCLNTLK